MRQLHQNIYHLQFNSLGTWMHNFLAVTVLLLPNISVSVSSLVQLSWTVIEISLGKLNLDTGS
jgi:hypothetical protein